MKIDITRNGKLKAIRSITVYYFFLSGIDEKSSRKPSIMD